ncbi:MAG: acid phosphatase [Rhodococcus sp.]|nr:acid phosphatase [Rhodococcus sp. (in: high G+C Gram-positive bacteria)]
MDAAADTHRIVLLRHGETEWSRTGQHTGATDIELTERGRQQAAAVGPVLQGLDLRDPLVVSSPRQRALDTAQLAGLSVDREWDAVTEWDYGDYEGLTTPQIREDVPDWTVWTHPCPGGEQTDHILGRADLVLSVARSQLSQRDVVIVGHGHFSRVLIARWLDLPVVEGRRFAMSPASFTLLGFEHGDTPQVLQHNYSREP